MNIFSAAVDDLSISETHFSLDKINNKLFLYVDGTGKKLTLSRAVPILENLGLSIAQCNLSEKDSESWQLAFEVQDSPKIPQENNGLNKELEDFLAELFSGHAENDVLNKLALFSDVSIHYLPVLRALTKYLQQIKINFSVDTLFKSLIKHKEVAELLIEYFTLKFSPSVDDEKTDLSEVAEKISTCIDLIHGRDDDLICRRYFSVLKAITRTNFYKPSYVDDGGSALSFKIEPRHIDGIPKPVPAYEIFIYNQYVEGVHLRGGKVARGGIRFSDRAEDYRTEVLGLVKAQMVKNSVIVPVGAKGGFICKVDNIDASKRSYPAYIKAGYEIFIRALLDLTDNRIDGKTIPPAQVVRHDDEDPYLVVAADKGTATFSDFANTIAAEYKYWLGDAFASGGQYGYDHKKMGITAKGTWQSAKRLFSESGKNIDNDAISVVGIGDMSGDVFGNGMLLSKNIKLVAAFNHKHIFIDPTPNAKRSYGERKRLFELSYSSWGDYNSTLLSEGGAIFDRTKKYIVISVEAARCLNISTDDLSMTPDALIKAILCANVDMLWNGGIGTYVKASDETDIDVSDKANDRVRINATELHASVVAEGGNLGLSQKARVEFALSGGLIHMDAVDNSAGVDCSDHEVNIKILLQEVIKDGLMTHEQRNEFLASMSSSVSDLVLNNNFRQSKMLSQSNYTSPFFFDSFVQLINLLERDNVLDRELACIPSPENIESRIAAQKSFTRPELATLLAYSKSRLFNTLVDSDLIEDEFFQTLLLNYFPKKLVETYPSYIKSHPLRKEILASYLTNDIANRMGATFCNYVLEEDTASITPLVKAHIVAVEIFGVNHLYDAIDQLMYVVDSSVLLDLQLAIHYPLDKAMTWLIQEGIEGDVNHLVQTYQSILLALDENIQAYMPPQDLESFNNLVGLEVNKGVGLDLAKAVYSLNYSYYVLPLAKIAEEFSIDCDTVLHNFFRIGEELDIFWLYELMEKIAVDDSWKRKNKKFLVSKIESHHVKALRHLLSSPHENNQTDKIFPSLKSYLDLVWLAKSKPAYNFSMVAVLVSKLVHLVKL
ncbi:MAG: glutamate dehydrogenase [Candidatus Endobugula sp.]|jgi:glutamate dehydrogenase